MFAHFGPVSLSGEVAIKNFSILRLQHISQSLSILIKKSLVLSIDEQNRLPTLLVRALSSLIRLLELLQVRIEQELDVEGSIAECAVEHTVEKRAC